MMGIESRIFDSADGIAVFPPFLIATFDQICRFFGNEPWCEKMRMLKK
ncbi:hypothetical protein TH3_07355 [Thalassospira xiamenensis M-5 = DSM 17429]|uniref:Uncharacterized protein n=1 Tax=Thalassospira xiamenensis M-5 = DSM 17429 TaxID=1123366 RepID=A0AB72UBF8_9PROT|nr:hypothetical protein TH3_07355 [Thalassospira xiamenensis M-5 = DSM 17429]